jgi:N-acetylneuraminic acid mutarotase
MKFKFFLILVSLIYALIYSFTAVASDWEILKLESAPVKGGEYAMVGVDNKIYLLGGRGKIPVNEFDLKTKTWALKSYPPIELHHFQATAIKNKIYVIGAFTGDYPNDTPASHVYSYDIDKNQWAQVFEIPTDRRRGAAALVEFKGKLYVVGGIVNGHMTGSVAWLDEYDPVKKIWTALPDAPHQRDHIQAAVINKKLVVVGGRQSSEITKEPYEKAVIATNVYDFKKKTWEHGTIGDIPTPRSGFSVAAHKDFLYVLGGESKTKSQAEKKVHADIEILDMKKMQWIKTASLPTPTHGFQAAFIKKKIYISNGNQDTEYMQVLDLCMRNKK